MSEASKPSSGQNRWYVLALLSCAYGLHSLDRSILSVVLEPIKAEFDLTDRSVGVLAGFAHSIAFGIASLPIGLLIDRTARVRLLAILLSIWSAFTSLCAFATGYWPLLLLRLGVGAAEAGGAPACMSLLSDLFPKKERATAIGVLYLSPSIGIALSFLMGGFVAAAYGWRAAFLVAGLPGIVLAILMVATIREPARTIDPVADSCADDDDIDFRGAVRAMLASPSMRHALAGAGLSSLVMTAVWTWAASLLIRTHGLNLAQAGLAVAVAAGACQAIGAALAGRMADRLSGGVLHRMCILPVASSCLAVPVGVFAVLSPSTAGTICGLMVLAFVFAAWIAPTYSIVLELAGPSRRGSTMSVTQLVTFIVGAGGGPFLVGQLSDSIGGQNSLRYALAITVCFNAWAAFHYWRLSRALRGRLA